MKPFSTVAKPHKDVFGDKLRMDVFAADLWYVFKGEGPEEYRDPNLFFKKTYLTEGLENILNVAQNRLEGNGGDPVIQLQTPFGGGKTHTLIALYHKANEIGANVVVIDGTALDPKDVTIWEEMERQLTGKIEKLKGQTSPGKDKIRELLLEKQPIMILMDEVLEYATKASGIKVGDSNLASQLLAFLQELTAAISTIERSMMILTLPSSETEHFDNEAESLYMTLTSKIEKVVGRVEMVYTPVQDEEIYPVIRRRLFSSVDEDKAENIIDELIDYADEENILPEEFDKAQYKKKFLMTYPFQPEVIDTLYTRWGSFPEFQRTRGALRFLSLIINSLKDSKTPIIRLSDFNLEDETIKRELLKYTGPEYNSIIAKDITLPESGSKSVNVNIGTAYLPFFIGTKVATTIFLYSFSGSESEKNGASIKEIQLSCIDVDVPSEIIEVAVSRLEDNLLYLHNKDSRLLFLNRITLNRVKEIKKESITEDTILKEEESLLNKIIGKGIFNVFKWAQVSNDIPDTKDLKLIIGKTQEHFDEFLENYGERPRINRNTTIFLAPIESERGVLKSFIKDKLAWERVRDDTLLELTKEQQKELKNKIGQFEKDSKEYIRNFYRIVLLPSKKGFKELDLGRHSYGSNKSIDSEIRDRLKSEDELTDKLSPIIVREKYLKEKEYVETFNIFESFYKTPGEIRLTSENVFKNSIAEGVKTGLFGLGILEDNKPNCMSFKKVCSPDLVVGEVLIDSEICKKIDIPPIKPEFIKEDYLKFVDYYETKELLESFVDKYPSVDSDILRARVKTAIVQGVKKGYFGLGILNNQTPQCISIKEECFPELTNNEIIIHPEICSKGSIDFDVTPSDIKDLYLKSSDYFKCTDIMDSIVLEEPEIDLNILRQKVKTAIVQGVKKGYFGLGILNNQTPQCISIKEECFPELTNNEIIIHPKLCKRDSYAGLELEFDVPVEKVADIIKMVAYLRGPFDNVGTNVKFKISAKDGEISISDYENKIKETLEQLNIDPSVEQMK